MGGKHNGVIITSRYYGQYFNLATNKDTQGPEMPAEKMGKLCI
jgi:hypothetical protein